MPGVLRENFWQFLVLFSELSWEAKKGQQIGGWKWLKYRVKSVIFKFLWTELVFFGQTGLETVSKPVFFKIQFFTKKKRIRICFFFDRILYRWVAFPRIFVKVIWIFFKKNVFNHVIFLIHFTKNPTQELIQLNILLRERMQIRKQMR